MSDLQWRANEEEVFGVSFGLTSDPHKMDMWALLGEASRRALQSQPGTEGTVALTEFGAPADESLSIMDYGTKYPPFPFSLATAWDPKTRATVPCVHGFSDPVEQTCAGAFDGFAENLRKQTTGECDSSATNHAKLCASNAWRVFGVDDVITTDACISSDGTLTAPLTTTQRASDLGLPSFSELDALRTPS